MLGFHFPWSRFPHAADHQKSEVAPWSRRWKWLVAVLVVAAAAAAWVGPRIARRLGARAAGEARAELALENMREARAALARAVALDPDDLGARRDLAHLLQETGALGAVSAWQDVAQRGPLNDQDHLAWARCAFLFGDGAAAQAAEAGLSRAGRATPEFRWLQAMAAFKRGDHSAAEAILAGDGLPRGDQGRFDRACLELEGGDLAEAYPVLLALAREGSWRIPATLELIQGANLADAPDRFGSLARQLLPPPTGPALFRWEAPVPGLFELIAHMEGDPRPPAAAAAQLGEWLVREGYAADAVLWFHLIGRDLQSDPRVRAARASADVRTQQWDDLAQTLRAGGWGPLPDAAITLALAARIQREQRHPADAAATWSDALAAAGPAPAALAGLLRLADELAWPEAAAAVRTRLGRS